MGPSLWTNFIQRIYLGYRPAKYLGAYLYANRDPFTGKFCLMFVLEATAAELGYLHPYQELTSV